MKNDLAEPRRGNRLGFAFFSLMLRLLGIRHTNRMAALVCLYYLLFDPRAVKRVAPYLRHLEPGIGRMHLYFRAWKIFHSQAKMLIERSASLMGLLKFRHQRSNFEAFLALRNESSNGIILLGAHFSNWQLMVEGLKDIDSTFNLVVNQEMNPAVRDSLKINSANSNIRYIFAGNTGNAVVEIAAALCRNEVVCMMGDRAFGADTVEVEFLNGKAHFPYGAYAIAAKLNTPVMTLLMHKDQASGEYSVHSGSVSRPQRQRQQTAQEAFGSDVQKYAGELETIIRKYPEQCFLFTDVWTK
ncbi:MAG: hypothetical protein A2X49_16550 [Lentisphaerae bacterium GWF2_52_8]|nr:MAG: hypothetical protein A2X49_16550 [Lentisphaerae bacterium GWF2_52_8]